MFRVSRKYPYQPQGRSLEFPRGRPGPQMPKCLFKGMYVKLNWKFQGGGGWNHTIALSWSKGQHDNKSIHVRIGIITWFWVQFGINKHKQIFQTKKIAQAHRASAICNLQLSALYLFHIAQKNHVITCLIIHLKICVYFLTSECLAWTKL